MLTTRAATGGSEIRRHCPITNRGVRIQAVITFERYEDI